jgi:hypothetical protein
LRPIRSAYCTSRNKKLGLRLQGFQRAVKAKTDGIVAFAACTASSPTRDIRNQEVRNKIFVGVAGRNVTVGIVCAVVQCHVTGVCVKHGYDLGFSVPVGNVVLYQLEVENKSRKNAFKLQGSDTERHLHIGQLHWDVDSK